MSTLLESPTIISPSAIHPNASNGRNVLYSPVPVRPISPVLMKDRSIHKDEISAAEEVMRILFSSSEDINNEDDISSISDDDEAKYFDTFQLDESGELQLDEFQPFDDDARQFSDDLRHFDDDSRQFDDTVYPKVDNDIRQNDDTTNLVFRLEDLSIGKKDDFQMRKSASTSHMRLMIKPSPPPYRKSNSCDLYHVPMTPPIRSSNPLPQNISFLKSNNQDKQGAEIGLFSF